MIAVGLSSALGDVLGLVPEPLALAALGATLIAIGLLMQARRNQKNNLKRIENRESVRKDSVTMPIFVPVPPTSNSLFGFKVADHSRQPWRPPTQSMDLRKNNTTHPIQ